MSSSVPPPLGASAPAIQPNEPLATASLVCGILSWVCLLGPLAGIPAIICGHMARGRIARSGRALAGTGMATVGLVLGYLSTIALIVAGIVALVLGAAALPFAKQGFSAAMTKPNAMILVGAVTNFKTTYGRMPLVEDGATEDERLDNKALIAVLQGRDTKANPQKTVFFATMPSNIVNGELVDAWGTPFNIAVDADGDGKVEVDDLEAPVAVAVWSSGPNKTDEQGAGDDLASWR